MRQQINLYQPIFREDRKALSALSVALGLLLIVAGLGGVTFYAQQRVATLAAAVETVRAQAEQQQQQLTRTTELRAARAKPVDVETRVKQLRTAVGERERALQVLQSGAAGQTTGFAARMQALARRHVPGLWLDGVQLSGTGPVMALQGATTDPDIVPLYLSSLANDAVLAGTRFDEFVIQRPDPKAAEQDAATDKPKSATAPGALRFSAGSTSLSSTHQTDTP